MCEIDLKPIPPLLSDGSPSQELLSRLSEAEEMANEARRAPPTVAPDPISLFEVKEALQVRLSYQQTTHIYCSANEYSYTVQSCACFVSTIVPLLCVQHNRHAIASHSVYTLTMEHILASLWHPSQQESLAKEGATHWMNHLTAHH